jgi:hypothetical protein
MMKKASERHSRPGECGGMVSGHGKQARGTYFLEITEEWTSQDMESKRASEGHSLAGEHKGMDCSGHGKEASERGALTT